MGSYVDNYLGSNIFGSNSQDKALDAQRDATNQANNTQKYIFDTQRSDYAPWRDAGKNALGSLTDNKFMDNFQGDPGYQFRLNEGMKAINSGASARGMGNSGATMKSLLNYGQNFASNEYNNAYNRNFGRLSSLAGLGAQANQGMAAAGQNYGNQVSNNMTNFGNASAAANIATGNRQAGLVGQAISGAAYFSDARLKTNVESVSPADLTEMKQHLKAYAFNYKNDEHGKGDWVGVLAQDLEKSRLGRTLVVENERGEKMIDTNKVLSMFLATMAVA